ncbi:hypothetical protein VB775_07175 [Pseudanabaena sp. CCNP1317]|nr:hypothetical protein [Pseudanabaena sp. CCNP1317]MEA5486595.1 hypothetical protein [Pseudanabaena sp. CCNP1317]
MGVTQGPMSARTTSKAMIVVPNTTFLLRRSRRQVGLPRRAGAGAAAGGLLGGAIGAAIPEHEIKHVEEAISKGSVLVGVHCDDSDDRERVRKIFKNTGASSVSSA